MYRTKTISTSKLSAQICLTKETQYLKRIKIIIAYYRRKMIFYLSFLLSPFSLSSKSYSILDSCSFYVLFDLSKVEKRLKYTKWTKCTISRFFEDSEIKTFTLRVAIAEFLAFFVRHVCFDDSVSMSRQPKAITLFRS